MTHKRSLQMAGVFILCLRRYILERILFKRAT